MIKALPELLRAGVINEQTADAIRSYYAAKTDSNAGNRLYVAFGILGATLVGLGILLLIAHNWDALSKTLKTALAFVPLIIGQLMCGWLLFKKQFTSVWKEAATTFLFFSIGACIALITQIYTIKISEQEILLYWMLLAAPIIYIMRSSIIAIMFVAGITWYCLSDQYADILHHQRNYYWALLTVILPHYYLMLRDNIKSNYTIVLNWILPISISLCLFTIDRRADELMPLLYFSLFSFLFAFGRTKPFINANMTVNGYTIFGFTGMLIILFGMSSVEGMLGMSITPAKINALFHTKTFALSVAVILLALCITIYNIYHDAQSHSLFTYHGLIFIVTYLWGFYSFAGMILMNLYLLILGIHIIRLGARIQHLGVLNGGLLIIALMAVFRFFESDISYVLRAALFVTAGSAFVAANILMIKKRKTYAQE